MTAKLPVDIQELSHYKSWAKGGEKGYIHNNQGDHLDFICCSVSEIDTQVQALY